MCPHGYHHSGSMATPALGTRDVRLHIVWIALWSHQSAQTASSERCIVQKVNVPQGGSPPNPKECSNCTGTKSVCDLSPRALALHFHGVICQVIYHDHCDISMGKIHLLII